VAFRFEAANGKARLPWTLASRQRANMLIRFQNTVEDMVVFACYYYDHSPAQRRVRARTVCAWVAIFLILYGLVAWVTRNPIWLFAGAFTAVLMVLIGPGLMRRSVAGNARREYREAANKAPFAPQELEVTDNALIGRSPIGESVIRWSGIGKVASHGNYTFIYLTTTTAIVIRREAVSEGSYEAFVDAVKQRVAKG